MTQSQLECKTIACKFANIAHNSSQQVQLQWWCIISHASEYKRIVINYKPCTRVNKWIGLWKSFSRQHEAKIFPTIWKNCSNLQKSECVLIKIHFEVVAKVSAIFKTSFKQNNKKPITQIFVFWSKQIFKERAKLYHKLLKNNVRVCYVFVHYFIVMRHWVHWTRPRISYMFLL